MMTAPIPFVSWEPAPFDSIKTSKAYLLRQKIDNGERLSREEKDWLTNAVNTNSFFKRAIPVGGWKIDFSDVLRKFWVKQYSSISEYFATDKTALRSYLCGRIDNIIEVTPKVS